jgi:hypothetical protein
MASIRPPRAYKSEASQIRVFNARQQQLLQRVAAAAGSGDLGLATRRSVALRELAGRANSVFLAVGLGRCAVGSSSMPL